MRVDLGGLPCTQQTAKDRQTSCTPRSNIRYSVLTGEGGGVPMGLDIQSMVLGTKVGAIWACVRDEWGEGKFRWKGVLGVTGAEDS